MTVSSLNMATSSDSAESSVRRRRVDIKKTERDAADADSCKDHGSEATEDTKTGKRPGSLQTGTYWLTRIVLLRFTAFIYCK